MVVILFLFIFCLKKKKTSTAKRMYRVYGIIRKHWSSCHLNRCRSKYVLIIIVINKHWQNASGVCN